MEGLLKKDPKDRISSEELINHPFLQNLEEESWVLLIIIW